MPYITLNTSLRLSPAQKEDLKTELGQQIGLIPGKVEEGLMVDISDGRSLYFAGQAGDLAFVEIRCFGPTAPEAQKAYAAAVYDMLQRQLGLDPAKVYYNHVDMNAWGAGGALRDF